MKTLNKYAFIAAILLLAAPHFSFAQRTRYSFDDGWQFHLGDIAMKQAVKSGMQGGLADANVKRVEGEEVIIAYTDRNKTIPYKESDWQDVNLPHDWLVETAPVRDYSIGSQPGGNGFHPGGVGFYRKEFDIPDEARGKRISLEFDGISRCSTVWVNGHLMGHHESGYTPSFYELSEVLRYGAEGKNVVLVKVDATDYEGWWYEGAGIYRHTWLVMTDPVHVKRFGTFVTTPEVTAQNASVNIETTVSNESDDDAEFTLESIIYDGSINAWGRDRFWHPDRRRMDEINADDTSLALLDAIETVVIEGNRVRCDRGWDIDLDDGATNYLIRNNLCLCGGIKLREGFHRTVENNILVNSTFHPHVWFKGCGDVFTRNVVMAPYEPVNIDEWGKLVDKNIFTDKPALDKSRDEYGTDAHSRYAALTFADPVHGDYTVTSSEDVLSEIGFVNFDMDGFGVVSARLKALAARPEFTLPIVGPADGKTSATILWNGLRVKTMDTMGEQSATGMDSQRGVYVVAVFDRYSKLNDYLRPNDVILAIDGKSVNNTDDLLGISDSEGGANFKLMEIFRNQASMTINID